MGVRNEVVQSAGKGQVHADLLSLAASIPFFPVSLYTLQPRHLQGTEAIRVKAVISAAASDHV